MPTVNFANCFTNEYTVFGLFFPASVLSLAILLWRLFTFYLPILVGGVFTMTAGVWGRGKKKISA